MTEQPVTREEAVTFANVIRQRWIAIYADLTAMPKPDPEVLQYFRNPSQSRRFARRLRSGASRPTWLTTTPEDLAQKHDYAAEHGTKVYQVHRLASAHKRIQSQIADGTFGELREFFEKVERLHLQITS